MEAAVRWSPHSTSDRERFLIIGLSDHSLTLHQIVRRDRAHIASHVVVTRQAHLTGINAFDWSRNDESLVVLGLKTGAANLFRLRDDDVAETDRGGNVLHHHHQHQQQRHAPAPSSDIVATFKPKQERKCNSVALSSDDWLAVGLDRTRADPACLEIFDASIGGGDVSSSEPIRKLCFNEPVSSVRFFPSSPQELLVGAQRSLIRLYDLRDNSPGNNAAAHVTTRNTHNISVDPLDENSFVSGGSTGDPGVTIWDKRWMVHSLLPTAPTTAGPSAATASLLTTSNLTLNTASASHPTNGAVFDLRHAVDTPAATIWSLRYSGQKRGRIGICANSGEIRVIDTLEGRASTLQNSHYLPANPYGGAPSWNCNRYVTATRVVQPAYRETRDGPAAGAKCVAFDWVGGTSGELSRRREQTMIALRPNGKVRLFQVPSVVPAATVTARGDLSVAWDDVAVSGLKNVRVAAERAEESIDPFERVGGTADIRAGERGVPRNNGVMPHAADILSASTTQRERCMKGYLWDCQRNLEIVAGDRPLERLWEVIARLQEQVANNGMVAESLDLSYVGVAGLWLEDVPLGPHRTLSSHPATITDAIVSLNVARGIPAFEGERTDYPEHRQLCLAVCGWQFTLEALAAECDVLIARGDHYQAILQAVAHGHKSLALTLLKQLISARAIPNIGLNALLASETLNADQRDLCKWMADDPATVPDDSHPALRALLHHLSAQDWRPVMHASYLPLESRVALALRFLNDSELSRFLQRESTRCIAAGDLDGILLTGLGTPQTMSLLQNYHARTTDLQTAVLAAALTNPRYLDDCRWDLWRETYFDQMQAWRAFTPRVRFTTQHAARLAGMANAVRRDGNGAVSLLPQQQPPPVPSQITLRCNHCQATLARHEGGRPLLFGELPGGSGGGGRGGADGMQTAVTNARNLVVGSPAASAGIVCSRCGRHMPRCGICKIWLGAPDPGARTAGGSGGGKGRNFGADSGLTGGMMEDEATTTKLAAKQQQTISDVMARFLTFCLRCGHGFHAHHARSWFEKYSVCPVPDCRCKCTVA